jgi:hypothetical protein
MKKTLSVWALAVGVCLWVTPLSADVWDTQTDDDNSSSTDNELIPGSSQAHDLSTRPGPTADEDWYVVGQKPFSSYEVVVDATSGDIGYGCQLARVDAAGAVIQACQSITPGRDYSRSLRWANQGSNPVTDQYVRVKSNSCTTNCGSDDVYHIRFYETTLAVPRFNNSGTQSTILLVQNTGDAAVSGRIFYFSGAGALLTSQTFTIAARGMIVNPTATAVPGQSGSMFLAHDGRYGWLAAKAVALEPATGFTFDTPAVPRIH